MLKRNPEYGDFIQTVFADEIGREKTKYKIKTITFQVTDRCNLRCSYCYQINKATHSMDFKTAKIFIDYLFEHRLDENYELSEHYAKGLIIEFIGGEPLLETKLIKQIMDYFEDKFIEYPDCIWGLYHKYNFATNGVNYFDPIFQELLNEYGELISCGVTIDGYKELHDSCRKFPNGDGSYDIAIKAALDLSSRTLDTGTKITVSPDNVKYVFEGLKNMINLGFSEVNINCVYEEGWRPEHAKILYEQLKLTADWLYKNNLQNNVYIAFFDPDKYISASEEEKNWCGCADCMYAIDYKGDIFPCIRFMESSLGKDAEPLNIGTVEKGFCTTEQEKNHKELLNKVADGDTCRNFEDKCKNCPIGSGCSWCTAYNYQYYGDMTKRTTFICDMHKAAALASKYFYLLTNNKKDYDIIKITKDLALDVITPDEWEKIQWGEMRNV